QFPIRRPSVPWRPRGHRSQRRDRMARPIAEIEGPPRSRRFGCIALAILVFLLLITTRVIAGYVIDVEWWREVGQLRTYFSMLLYEVVPAAIAALIAF